MLSTNLFFKMSTKTQAPDAQPAPAAPDQPELPVDFKLEEQPAPPSAGKQLFDALMLRKEATVPFAASCRDYARIMRGRCAEAYNGGVPIDPGIYVCFAMWGQPHLWKGLTEKERDFLEGIGFKLSTVAKFEASKVFPLRPVTDALIMRGVIDPPF